MIYIISSNTPWPCNPRQSVKLIYPMQERKDEHDNCFLFGDFLFVREMKTVIHITDPLRYVYYNLKSEEVNLQDLEIGKQYESPAVAILKIPYADIKFPDLTTRAANLFEFYEYAEGDTYWRNLKQLINLAIKKMNNYVDTFFINLSFFPNSLFKNNHKEFFEILFGILNSYENQRFVLIVDPQKDLHHLNCFGNLLEKYKFDKGIILEVTNKTSSEKENQNNKISFLTTEIFCEEEDKSKLYSFIERNINTDVDKLVKDRFIKCIKNSKKDNSYWTKKKRLEESLSDLNNIGYILPAADGIYSFMNRYLSNDINKSKFLFCFQRLNVPFIKKEFDLKMLKKSNVESWYNLDKILTSCRAEHINDYYKKHNYDELYKINELEEIKDPEKYHRAKYFCGHVSEGKGKKKIPECNNEMKDFIIDSAICTDMTYDDLVKCLGEYGFAFPRFSRKNLLVEYVIRESKELSYTGRYVKYETLKLYMPEY